MNLEFDDGHRRAVFEARVLSTRVHQWVLERWTVFASGVLVIAARAGTASLPMAQVELVLATASVSATLVLIDVWVRDAHDIRRGSMQAIAAAALSVVGTLVDL